MPRSHRRALRGRWASPEPECFKLDLKSLTLPDLTKLQKSLLNYNTRSDEVRAKNAEIRRANEVIDLQNAEAETAKSNWIKRHIGPLAIQIRELEQQLSSCSIGGVRALFEDRFDYTFTQIAGELPRYESAYHRSEPADRFEYVLNAWDECTKTLTLKTYPGAHLAQRHLQLFNQMCELRSRCPKFPEKAPQLRLLPSHNSTVSLTISGSRLRIDLSDLREDELRDQIALRHALAEEKAKEIHVIKARAAKKESEVRRLARQAGASLQSQMSVVPACPYCSGSLTEDNARLDHIYPVSKGGLSAHQNLIFVCVTCNAKKSNHTLRRFVEDYGLNQEIIHRHLTLLRKDF